MEVVTEAHMVDVNCGGGADSRHGVEPDELGCLCERSEHGLIEPV
jgi:hypothetical protein